MKTLRRSLALILAMIIAFQPAYTAFAENNSTSEKDCRNDSWETVVKEIATASLSVAEKKAELKEEKNYIGQEIQERQVMKASPSEVKKNRTTSNLDTNYLTFTAVEDEAVITPSFVTGTWEYSADDGESWTQGTNDGTTHISLDNVGDSVLLRGTGCTTNTEYHFYIYGLVSASGSVTSLTDRNGTNPEVELTEACYSHMFSCCDGLTEAPELPAKTLAVDCYFAMFCDCFGLTEAPELPAETLAEECYSCMFYSCIRLTEAPELPAKTLADRCYNSMFHDCDGLTEAPDLPAETLAEGCYSYMFYDCDGLTEAPDLPAETLAEGCYSSMFYGCDGLKQLPEISATTLAEGCCYRMFANCKELNIRNHADSTHLTEWTTPDATNVDDWNEAMFDGCVQVETQRPALNTTYYLRETTPAPNYLTFTAIDGTATVTPGFISGFWEYSMNGGESWEEGKNQNTYIYLSETSNSVLLRGWGCKTDLDHHFTISGKVAASGNVTSLADGNGGELNVLLTEECYSFMFFNCTDLVEAPAICASKLPTECCYYMFSKCTGLIRMPELSATTLTHGCYAYMFEGCSMLSLHRNSSPLYTHEWTVPDADTQQYWNSGMFSNCSQVEFEQLEVNTTYYQRDFSNDPNYLTFTAVEGPASITPGFGVEKQTTGSKPLYETVGKWEYSLDEGNTWKQGFSSVTKIVLEDAGDTVMLRGKGCATCLNYHFKMTGKVAASGSITSLMDGNGGDTEWHMEENGWSYMFSGCSSLVQAPELPFENLAKGCYKGMFKDCYNLKAAPNLPAETLADSCYSEMFSGCGSLVKVPDLPAEILPESCYASMFESCYNLKILPVLSAKVLGTHCCQSMFKNCHNLILKSYTDRSSGIVKKWMISGLNAVSGWNENMFSGCINVSVGSVLPSIPYYTQAEDKIVLFDMQGHGEQIGPQVAYKGATIDRPNDPAETGYVFHGWYTEAEYENVWDFNNDIITDDLTLYAKWALGKYTISFDSDGGSAVASITQGYNTEVTKPASPTKTGYTFAGWDPEVPENMPAENLTLKAQWTVNKYTIKFSANGGTGTMADLMNVAYDTTRTLTVNAFKRTGYTFSGWSTTTTGSVKYTDRASVKNLSSTNGAAVTLYAVWTVNKYTIKFSANGGTGTMASLSGVSYDTYKTLTANKYKRTGYSFSGWSTTSTGSVKYKDKASVKGLTATNNATVTLYAKWTANKYTIKFNANGGTGSMASLSSVSYGTYKTLTANKYKRTGYTFAGWSTTKTGTVKYKDKASVKSLTATNNGTVTLYAVWTKTKYKITYNLNGGKNNTKNPTSFYYTTADIKLQNPTRTGYTFLGWYSDSKFKTKVTVIKKGSTGNKTLYAKWKKK